MIDLKDISYTKYLVEDLLLANRKLFIMVDSWSENLALRLDVTFTLGHQFWQASWSYFDK